VTSAQRGGITEHPAAFQRIAVAVFVTSMGTRSVCMSPTRADAVTEPIRSKHMIFLGIVLLIIGFVASIPIFWTIGIILLVIGIVLELMGMAGHAVAGRRHYY
jgi:hypothetical protein